MQGNMTVRFLELFADTLAAHGWQWSYDYYVTRRGMDADEFLVWCASAGMDVQRV